MSILYMSETFSLTVDSNKTRRLQDVASKIKTRYNSPEDFVDDAVGYFINMWQKPEFTYEDFIGFTKHMSDEDREVFKAYGGKIKEDIEKQEKDRTEKWINETQKEIGKFQFVGNTEFRFPIEPSRDEEIQNLFNEYPKLKDFLHGGHTKAFVNEAIDIFCLMWSDTEKFQIRLYNIYDLLPKKITDHWQENFPEAFEIFITQYKIYKKNKKIKLDEKVQDSEQESLEKKINLGNRNVIDEKDFKKIMEKHISKKSNLTLPRKNQAFISQFQGRFFPMKVVTRKLAELIYENHGQIIDYTNFSNKCYEYALEISKKLKEIEEKEPKIKRNKKFSTGLPAIEENDKTKKRFLEHYVGITDKAWRNRQKNDHNPTFDGALNSCGFAYFESEIMDEKSKQTPRIKIGITKRGLDFGIMKNDILDNFQSLELSRDNWKYALTEEESKFIQKEVLQEFPFEESLIESMKKEIKNTHKRIRCQDCDTTAYACSHVIDKKFEEWTKDLLSKHDLKKELFGDIDFLLIDDSDEKKYEKKKQTLEQLRTATVGRLSELGVIEWKISTKEDDRFKNWATSYYKIIK